MIDSRYVVEEEGSHSETGSYSASGLGNPQLFHVVDFPAIFN